MHCMYVSREFKKNSIYILQSFLWIYILYFFYFNMYF